MCYISSSEINSNDYVIILNHHNNYPNWPILGDADEFKTVGAV